ncbi:uncharacterized protein [Branchiostoma lanceolatum]|uniref:uncharacterized protein isoform X2 n=1 Tax=Branchiostoma lanceolatum TaxID=7740 RepID=UPI003453965C
MKSAGQVVLFAVILSFLESVTAEVKNKDHLEPINDSAQHGESARWPLSGHNQGSVGTFGDLATEMQKDKKLSEYVSSLRLVGEHLQRLTGKIVALDVHLLNYRRKGQETSEPFKRVLGFINGQSRELDGEDISTSNRMVLLSGYIGIVRTITSRAVKIVHNLNSLGATLRELERTIDGFDEILPPEGLQLSLGGALELLMTDTYQCPEFHHVETPDIPEMQQENVNVTLLDFAIVAEHSDRVSRITQEARDIIEEVKYIKNIISYSSTLLHAIDGTVVTERNVALNKKASQSSLFRSEYPAERAVDGNTGTVLYPRQECTHTDQEYEPWWKVDLGDTYVISHVTVINRGDCCGERLRNFMVRVGPFEDIRENPPCGDIYSETPSDGETIDVLCAEPISGRWVSVQLIGREDYLSLCEVQVFSGSEATVDKLTDETSKRWRDDLRCGSEFPAPNAQPGECDPDSCFPCCSQSGYCGNTPEHCDCADCVNYGFIYGVEQSPAWSSLSEEALLSVPWRKDFRCGPGFSAPGAEVAECNPHSCNPCCSGSGWCGNTEDHCGCPDCVDYRSHGVAGLRWREDGRCGPEFPAPGTDPGECDPISLFPCCSAARECGGTAAHCKCEWCIDFRSVGMQIGKNTTTNQIVDDTSVTKSCQEHQFSCTDGKCLPPNWRCDGDQDCSGGEDEESCGQRTCTSDEFECTYDLNCISVSSRCNNVRDCDDGSDEEDCENFPCKSNQLRCGNTTQCISIDWRCDADDDCDDGSDEKNCGGTMCQSDEFQCSTNDSCISRHWRCDGELDCRDGSDEENCTRITCGPGQFQCSADKKCIQNAWRCDGDPDCVDGTDEDGCGTDEPACSEREFQCISGSCIHVTWRCDNDRDCPDGSDELNCDGEAAVTCSPDQFQCSSDKKCVHGAWRCDGESDCDDDSDEEGCEGTVENPDCGEAGFRCSSGRCIHAEWRCDKEKDCPDGSDELNCNEVTEPPDQGPVNRSQERWREDLRCGPDFPAPGASQGECDPESCFPCCSQYGYCGNTDDHCLCDGCVNYGTVYGVEYRSGWIGLKGDDMLSVKWTEEGRCGPGVSAPGAEVAECNPHSCNPCCSPWGWCGNTEDHCDCSDCVDYRTHSVTGNRWREDGRCGPEFPAPGADPGECDPISLFPCCSAAGECGGTAAHCKCEGCIDFRNGTGTVAVSPSPPVDREYMGCYKDSKKRRLPKGPKISQEMTTDLCIEHCRDEGYNYAGTQYYEECWCGNERHFSRIGRQRKNKQCSTPCRGNEDEKCGGPWRLAVYKVGKKIKKKDESKKEEVNVALNKEASQSSLLRSEYPAERAVDGNTGTVLYPRQECTHTDLEYEPWWKVDLGDTYVISHVTVINRGDCCGERLRNFMVRVGPFEDLRENTPCGDIYSETPSDGETIDVRCAEPISGRWVSVQLIGREDYLSLCEVQVYAVAGQVAKRKWRDDWHCGPGYSAEGADPAECDPTSCFPCCSAAGWCGNTEDHCDCPGCTNFQEIYGTPLIVKEETIAAPNRRWRDDFRCGPDFPAPGADPGECDPHSCFPCCSASGHCGNVWPEHCNCPGCVDYRFHNQNGSRWRDDLRCGPDFPAPGAASGECDPVSFTPCCSLSGFCGSTEEHCTCEGCVDFRTGLKENQIHPTSTTDEDSRPYLLFSSRQKIRKLYPDSSAPPEVMQTPDMESVVGLDFHWQKEMLFYTDVHTNAIYRMYFNDTERSEVVVDVNLVSPEAVAVDWVGDNLFWTDSGTGKAVIEMANLDGSYRKTFLREGLERPRGLAVDPVNGYLFFSEWGEGAKIERVTLDGKDRKVLVSSDIRWPNSIALDVAQGRLFWTDSGMDRIESITTDGNNRKKLVEMELAPHSYGITVFEDKIFWTDWRLNGVYSADKSTGRNPTVVYEHESERNIFDIKMVDKDRQQGTSPCAINNGGCSHFCLNTPTGHTCACPDRPKIDRKYCRASAGKSGLQPSPTEAHHRMNRSDMAKVEGYSPRRGDCPGNDIWSIYRDNTSLENCADLCTSHSDCVSFMFYNNHRCYPKTKTCAETTKTNPRDVFYDRIIDDDPLECLTDSEGTTYRGRVRLTKSGRTCQRWDSSSPHKHKYLQKYPYHGLEEDFCRNPDGRPDAERPWCYTTDLHVRWEYCDIPECGNSSRECIDDSTYNGKVQVTLSGRTCQRWDSETPHVPKIRSPLPGLNENYCRNLPELGEHNWPWCYTIDPDIPWEYCRMESCVTDVLEAVGGYAPRHGDCPGNDIWSIYEDYVTLEECAQMCTNHPDCVSFMFYDNHRCYPKTKTCAETIKSNPRNVFYDRIIEKETKRKWREDYHCGFGFSAEGSDPAECDPHSCFPCCSAAGWCGNTPDHCDCPECTDYQKEYGVAPIKSIAPGPDDSRRWRDDYRCGPDFPAPGADPGECDPHSCFPCCSAAGHCGNIGVEHCDCPGCVDYRYHNQNGSRWRDDLRCGPDFPAPGSASGECDPVSFTPCCSLSGFCGSTEEHCTCEGCVDFRTGSGVKEVSPTTTVEPLECLTDSEGTSYRGTRQYTKSGLTCQRWDSTFPHENKYFEKYPNRGLDENFCRNPDGRPDAERPWCYTIDPDVRWEYCDIPVCEDVDATDCELTLEEQAVGCKASDSAQICSGHGECVCGQCECWHFLPIAKERYTGQYCECDNLSCDRYMGEICGGHGACQCGQCVCEEGWTGTACQCSESVDNCLSSNGLICNNHGLCQCGVCRCDPYNIYYGPQCDDCATCPGKCETLRECGEFLAGGRKDFMEVCSGVKVVKAKDINTDSSKLCRFMSAADREFEFTYEYDTDGGVVVRYNLVPSIVHPPVDTTGVDGGIVSLFCEANVKLPIVWTKGGSKISARARDRYDVVEYQDGRASMLRIDPLRSPRDEDTFTCRMESAEYGTVEEASVSINVLAEENLPDGFPTITQGPQLKAVERGRPAILVCSASGDPAPDITWLKDMVPVDMTDSRIKLLSSGSLQINSTTQEDEGRYECVATNNLGTRYSYPANLYIRVRRVPPRFNIIPEDVEVNLGDNINLTCAAIGPPVPFVQWLKDNKDLSDKTALSGRNILRLENVVESANYTCFASSPLGVIEHTVLVTVKVRRIPPRLIIIPEAALVNRGDNINLTCVAIGSPVPFVQWQKGNENLSEKSSQKERNILRLENVVKSANYTCAASNPFGSDVNTAQVIVEDDLAMVDGYTARRGDCPGNDIWAIYTRSTTLEECARMCTRHPRCVTFMFFDNQECYPKSKSCDETTKTNPKNVFYDRIVEGGADGPVDSQPAAALHSEPKWLSFPPRALGRYAGRLRSLETESTEAETKSEASGIVRKIFGLPIFRKRRHVAAQQDDSSSDSFLAIGGKTYRFPSQPQERYAVEELSTLPYHINRFLEVLVHLRQCTLTDGQEQQGMASTKEQKDN